MLSSQPVAAEQKYLSNTNVRTGEGNPTQFSRKPWPINNSHLRSRSPVKIQLLEKGGAPPRLLRRRAEKSLNQREQKGEVHLSFIEAER